MYWKFNDGIECGLVTNQGPIPLGQRKPIDIVVGGHGQVDELRRTPGFKVSHNNTHVRCFCHVVFTRLNDLSYHDCSGSLR